MIKFTPILAFSAALMLSACGGGGGATSSSARAATPTATNSNTTFTTGQFEPASGFKDQCAAPRRGTDINGATWPDQAGSTALENFWLRSWSNETYLWYNEIVDRDPNGTASRLDYFELMKTTATTTSGTPKDQFHFTENTESYQQRVNAGTNAGYGVRFALLSPSVPRDIRIAYTQAGSPAAGQLPRGTKILRVDGEDAVNGGNAAALNAGLFPAAAGETHTFVVQDDGSTETRTVTLTSATITTAPVTRTRVIPTETGNVGYIHFTTFGTESAEAAIAGAMRTLQNQDVTDLVLDLRYNGGGFLAIAAQLGYMTGGAAATRGKTFDRLVFNDKHPTINPVTGRTLTPTPFISEGVDFSLAQGTSLPALNLPRVFVLTTGRTCSASEAVMNGLRGADVEVIQIGTRTCGKPYGFYATDNCGETYFTVQFRGENNKGFGDYTDGFQPQNAANLIGVSTPGCEVADDFSANLGDEDEALLSAALRYREDASCPPAALAAKAAPDLSQVPYYDFDTSLLADPRIARAERLSTLRIENRPDPRETPKRETPMEDKR